MIFGIVQRRTLDSFIVIIMPSKIYIHLCINRQERNAYMNRAALAHRAPHEYFSVAIDGMDQSKTELPNSKLRFKTLDTAWKLKVHIVGTMVHGRHPICFLDYHQHAHDSNLIANIILQVQNVVCFLMCFLIVRVIRSVN